MVVVLGGGTHGDERGGQMEINDVSLCALDPNLTDANESNNL